MEETNMSRWFLSILLLWLISCGEYAYAYDSDFVHPAINYNATLQSNLESYLEEQLKLSDGIDTTFNKQKTWKWVEKGGELEDEAPRWLNHFHDPLKPWDEAGFCVTPLACEYDSSLLWAQKNWQNLSGTFSWITAREAFYAALTTNSEAEYAMTFRALGQVIHLVADAAVPAHVRNDPHPTGETYESYAREIEKKYDGKVKPQWWAINFNGIKPAPGIFEKYIPNTGAPVPISALWDIDRYTIDSGAGVTQQGDIGLAEYTNANFFSDDTIIINKYPHPALEEGDLSGFDWGNLEELAAEDNKTDNRYYIWKTNETGETYRLASFSLVSLDGQGVLHPVLVIDDQVVLDYANLLVPHAVGYSAALLDYFFRSRIDMEPTPNGSGYIVLNEGDEALSDGILELFYDAVDGNRYPVNGAVWDIPEELAAIPAGGASDPLNFIPPGDAKKPGEYMLVYRGEMGGEKDAVAGKFVKRKKYLVMKRGFTYKQYIFWDIDKNEPAKIKRAGSEEFISWPTNKYGDRDVGAFFLSHNKLATEELFIKEPIDFIYSDWAEDSYVFAPNGFPSPCDVCNAEYTEERTLKRTLLQEPHVEQTSSTVKQLWTDSWDCNYSQGYEQYVCDGLYSSVSGWEAIETHEYLPYEPVMYNMHPVSGNLQKDEYRLVENSNIFAQNMNAKGQIILNLETYYSSRIDGWGGRDHPTLGDIWGVHIGGARKEETLNNWEIVNPWFVHNFSQVNSKVSETRNGRYYGVYRLMDAYFPAKAVLRGFFNNEEIVFRAYYILYREENKLYENNGFPADYEPALVPGKEEPFCVADSSILVTDDTSAVNPFIDMPKNPELSTAICDFWKVTATEDGYYNYAVTFEIWE